MEDYEKLYKDVLAKAREIHRNENEKRSDMEWLFPELKESENERVKKRILLSLEKDLMATKNSGCDTQDLEQCIAWLEKQSKSSDQIHYWTEEEIEPIISDYLRGVEHYGGMIGRLRCLKPKSLEKQGETFTKKDVDDAYLKGICDAKHELEKQGEQKPVLDFKASNWYVSKVDGKIHDMTYNPTDKVEPKFKVGDYIVYDYCMGRVVEITNDAYLLDAGQGISFLCEDNMHLWTIADAKEGDILAGKIDGDNYILIFKTIEDGWIETYGHYYNAVDKFCAPSQLFCRSYQGTFTPATKEQRDLLFQKMKDAGYEWDVEKKELKKIEKKQEWSEEDNNFMYDTLSNLTELKDRYGDGYGKVGKCIDWLKSLKDRIGWKPSEKQMNALLGIMVELGFNYIDYNTLESLYNDLKKL